ncbi:PP2C family protein-serine/threonine phosphatase [Nonomuraea jiangxiensis]|uniref:Serine phosphatase RsbU, regulator of sigma subunit n=1 Tax=Nonomuraea jiangxiensis TaxID=633440 RepID=A0A1G9F6J5_9ACTN|nr:PP2C family protein-serine/threonine phosphatase [Nonomuraea jiangxiensis]SDK84004.1 Serine phosphatase RsbU, regulator of sigma subunit [Nonomuraea jiangxiensis]
MGSIPEGLHAVQQAMHAARPYAVVEALRDAVTLHFAVEQVEVLLADYALVTLRPVLIELAPGARGVAIDGTPAGRAFAAQSAQVEDRMLYLPVSACGERIGVLSLRFAEPPGAAAVEELQEIATALGHALRGADLITDRYQRVRRMSRLTLAAEMQWGLLPGCGHQGDGYRLAGQLEPAYAVYGDNFDWTCGPRWLALSVTDGMGAGMDAALLTTLAITALRNARRSGADLEEQAGLADEAIYAQYGGRMHVSTLLLRFDATTGEAAMVDAGSPRVLIMRGGQVRQIELEQQLPLGMFGNTTYTEQHLRLEPGDRLIVASDGVHSSRSSDGTTFGGSPLESLVKLTRMQPADEAVRTMIRGLLDFRRGMEVLDDAVVVCLDWTPDPAVGPAPSGTAGRDRP